MGKRITNFKYDNDRCNHYDTLFKIEHGAGSLIKCKNCNVSIKEQMYEVKSPLIRIISDKREMKDLRDLNIELFRLEDCDSIISLHKCMVLDYRYRELILMVVKGECVVEIYNPNDILTTECHDNYNTVSFRLSNADTHPDSVQIVTSDILSYDSIISNYNKFKNTLSSFTLIDLTSEESIHVQVIGVK